MNGSIWFATSIAVIHVAKYVKDKLGSMRWCEIGK
jgi:hypothetical protein